MSRSFDFILAGASLIVGILLLTGHGDFFICLLYTSDAADE